MYIKCNPVKIHNAETVAEVFRDILKNECEIDQQKEHFWVMGLNAKNRVLYIELVTLGILNESLIHPREVFRSAVIKGISRLIFCHNHPSGEVEPSKEDIDITKRLREGGKLLGLRVLDHIIISDNDLFSFQQGGLIKG